MRRWLAAAGLMFAVGCGGSAATGMPPDPLMQAVEGNWIFQGTTGVVGLNLNGDASYSVVVAVPTGAATANVQLEDGAYALTASTITVVPAKSSCPGAHPAYRDDYTVTATSLTLSDSTGATMFVRNNSAAGSEAATYGCFASDGTFTPSPLTPI